MPELIEETSDIEEETLDQNNQDSETETTEQNNELCTCGRNCPEYLRDFHYNLFEYSPDTYDRHMLRLQQIEEDLGDLGLAETLEALDLHLREIETQPLLSHEGEIVDIEEE